MSHNVSKKISFLYFHHWFLICGSSIISMFDFLFLQLIFIIFLCVHISNASILFLSRVLKVQETLYVLINSFRINYFTKDIISDELNHECKCLEVVSGTFFKWIKVSLSLFLFWLVRESAKWILRDTRWFFFFYPKINGNFNESIVSLIAILVFFWFTDPKDRTTALSVQSALVLLRLTASHSIKRKNVHVTIGIAV